MPKLSNNSRNSSKTNLFASSKIVPVNPSAVGAGEGSSCSNLTTMEPSIWLLDRAFDWHPLARDFGQYFRMMLVHQGLPQWQFLFTKLGLTPWAEVSEFQLYKQSYVLCNSHIMMVNMRIICECQTLFFFFWIREQWNLN